MEEYHVGNEGNGWFSESDSREEIIYRRGTAAAAAVCIQGDYADGI